MFKFQDGGEEGCRAGDGGTGPAGTRQAACVWEVTARCMVHHQSSMSAALRAMWDVAIGEEVMDPCKQDTDKVEKGGRGRGHHLSHWK